MQTRQDVSNGLFQSRTETESPMKQVLKRAGLVRSGLALATGLAAALATRSELSPSPSPSPSDRACVPAAARPAPGTPREGVGAVETAEARALAETDRRRAAQARPKNRPDPTRNRTMLGHLETRDRRVTVLLGPAGPRYRVEDRTGRVLHVELTEQELQARAPELHRLVKEGYAGGGRGRGVTLDARVQPFAGRER